MLRSSIVVAVLLTAAPAHADDAACKAVTRVMKAKEWTRASLLVDACWAEDEERGAKLQIQLEGKFEELHYARVDIETRPSGGMVVVDLVADLPFEAPRTVWLPPGVHDITALVDGQPVSRTTLNLKSDSRGAAMLDLPGEARPDTEVREIDFGEEGGPPELTTAGPEDEKFASLLPDKYLRGMGGSGGEAETAARRGWWRLALGVATGSVTDSAGGLVLELERRAGVGGPWWLAGAIQLLGGYASGDELSGGFVIQGSAAAIVQVALPFGTRLGAGPSVALVDAPFDGSGRTFGGTVMGEVAIRRYTFGIRLELPLLATDDHAITGAGMFGVRW